MTLRIIILLGLSSGDYDKSASHPPAKINRVDLHSPCPLAFRIENSDLQTATSKIIASGLTLIPCFGLCSFQSFGLRRNVVQNENACQFLLLVYISQWQSGLLWISALCDVTWLTAYPVWCAVSPQSPPSASA